MPLSLSAWETFYVITGSAGAALTGLMFVVVALAAERRPSLPVDGLSAFSTPTVTHFAGVLLLAGIMTIPVQRVLSLSLCLGGCGAAGLIAAGLAAVRVWRLEGYAAVKEDWTWHVILPFIAYLALFSSALLLGASQEPSLVMVAVVVLMLLLIGIHNAWDVAVFLVVQQTTEPGLPEPAAASPPREPGSGRAQPVGAAEPPDSTRAS